MSYIVTARKWRPMVFEDVVGQAHVTTTLRNAIASDRLSHAYIFSGPRGVGKTTTARILAKAINCLKPVDNNPDNKCELCLEITENRSLNVFEIDGASNRGVDEIRNLREAVRYAPAKGKYKVYIIDEVHMLTKEAFNALLKTLEEPPEHVLFIFATTEIQKVPLTILSRCQRFEFRRIAMNQIMDRLRFIAKHEKLKIEDDALFLIARKGDGSLRDAQSIFDQIVSFCGDTITVKQIVDMLNIVEEEYFFRLIDVVRSKDTKAGLALIDELVGGGIDIREFLNGVSRHLRNLLIVRATGSSDLVETSEFYRQRYAEQSQFFSENDLLRFIRIITDTDAAVRWSQQPRFRLEVGILQMLKMDSSVQIQQLLDQIEELKKKLNIKPPENSPRKVETAPKETPELIVHDKKAELLNLRRELPRPQQMYVPPVAAVHEPRPPAVNVSLADASTLQPAATENPVVSLTMDASVGKWPALIEEACKHRIALGTMLSETTLIDVKDNKLHIGCPDDFHFDALKRNRDFLTDLARKVYGAKVQLETILSNNVRAAEQPLGIGKGSAIAPAAVNKKANAHPVVEAIIREFGAQRVD
jgi:DNA polymerase III subunit gamma/tau